MTEPQETIPLTNGKPATCEELAGLISKYGTRRSPLGNQHITVEIDGEYYQATLAITKEDDILDAGHLVIRPLIDNHPDA